MRIGVPKEIKPQENRIGLTPESVKILTSNGHEVLVESNGGSEAGFDNDYYKRSGAKIVNKAEDIFNDSEIIVKVKEPLSNEIKMDKKPGAAGFTCFKHCYDAGINFKATGDCLIIAPQFICEKKHIDEIIEKLRTGISNYMKK